MGTGIGTAASAGGLDFHGPGRDGPWGSIGGRAGVLSWASKTGPNSKAAQIKTRIRFMGGKAAKLKQRIRKSRFGCALASGLFGHN